MKQISILFLLTLLFGCSEETPERDKFLGEYAVMESCSNLGDFAYNISIGFSNISEDEIEISNFGDFQLSLQATVSGDQMSFDEYLAGIDAQVVGTGSISDGVVSINYVITNQYQDIAGNTFTDSCSKICTRK